MNGIVLASLMSAGVLIWAFVYGFWCVIAGYLVPRRSPPPLQPSPEPRDDEEPLVSYDDIAQWIPARTRSDIERGTGIRSWHGSLYPDDAPLASNLSR